MTAGRFPRVETVDNGLDLHFPARSGHVINAGTGLIAFTGSSLLAHRVVELLDRHGLVDIPDFVPDDIEGDRHA